MKKTAAILLSLLLVVCLIPVSVFADAPEPAEAPTEFTITGWWGYSYGSEVLGVKINGEDLPKSGASIKAAPGATLTVEVILENGFELYQYEDDDSYFWWEYDETADDIGWCIAGTTPTQITLPGEDLLALTDELTLCFETEYKLTAINSVTINGPEIKEGEGYTIETIQEDGRTRTVATPPPEVTVPEDAPYVLVYAAWAQPSDDPNDMYGLGFKEAYEDVVFEAGKDYYYYVYLVAKDVMEQGMELGPDGIRLFSVDNPPKVNVGHGVEVDHIIPYKGEDPRKPESRAISGPASAEMLVLAKVSIPKPAPSTADMNPVPWVWTMVLALGLVFTAVYYEIVDIRRFNQGK